jgi:HD-GYP domain-containing protein (c-di-GMP phosphodiesterase class II)
MTTDRPYRKGLTKEEAIHEIEKQKGKQFNPVIADAFINAYKKGKF